MIKQLGPIALSTIALGSCTSVGQVGAMTDSSADPGVVIREAHPYHEIGPAKGTACLVSSGGARPLGGDPTASQALEEARAATSGDALLNVTVYIGL